MPCTPPTSISPGYIALVYDHLSQSVQHKMRVRLESGANPYDYTSMAAIATLWAAALTDLLTSSFQVVGWNSYDETGRLILTDFFTTPIVGTHTRPAGSADDASKTLTITGRGDPGGPSACTGEVRNVVFIGDSYNFPPRSKVIVVSSDVDIGNYAAFLGTGGNALFADFYGQKGVPRGNAPIQFNAATQKRTGT